MPSVVISSGWGMFHELWARRLRGWHDLSFRDQWLASEIPLSAPGTSGLHTAAKELIPAINELHARMLLNESSGVQFMYTAAAVQTINAANQYHAVIGFNAGVEMEGLTFQSSSSGVITNTANNGGILRCTDAGHGLTTGQYVTLNGMGDLAHVASSRVTVIDLNTFDCDNIAFSSIGDTGFWQRGSALIVESGYGRKYHIDFTTSFLAAGNNKNYKFEVVVNNTDIDEIVAERKIAILNDLGCLGASGVVTLNDLDVVWLQVMGTTDSTNCTIEHANLNLS